MQNSSGMWLIGVSVCCDAASLMRNDLAAASEVKTASSRPRCRAEKKSAELIETGTAPSASKTSWFTPVPDRTFRPCRSASVVIGLLENRLNRALPVMPSR